MLNKLKEKINVKILIFLFILVFILGIIYFQFPLVITPDGSQYFLYTQILDGDTPLSEWSITRGPTFPILLYLFKHLFGENQVGLLIGFFIFYLILLGSAALILNSFLKKYNKNHSNSIYWILFILLIMLNPIIIGYSHSLLTETIAPGIILLTTYFAYLWKDVSWKTSRKTSILYTVLFSFIITFMWFLKQPYMAIIFFIIGISSILSGIYYKSWKIFLEKVITLLIGCLVMLVSIFIWNNILKNNGVDTEASNSTQGFLSKGIVNSLAPYYNEVPKEKFCSTSYIKKSLLNENEKDEILSLSKSNKNWCNQVKMYEVYDSNGSVTKNAVIITDKNEMTTFDGIEFLIENTLENPNYTILSYYRNYMATINLYPTSIINNKYIAGKNFGMDYESENKTIGLSTYSNGYKCWWKYPGWGNEVYEREDVKYINHYCPSNENNNILDKVVSNTSEFYLDLFKIVMLLTFPLTIISFIMFIKNKKSEVYFVLTILFGSAFLHVMFHAATGAIIDRYAYAAFPAAILGIIILLIPKNKNNSLINESLNKDFKKNKVTEKNSIFVIPAYNESKHIEKVIKDIRKNMPNSDIVVTNDCSKDNTKEIVESLGVPCLNVPFNMGYAMAVQTGIKYAYENNYDYVIQFDADGQHLSSEVKKLFKKMKETDANVVIGSRFLEKTGYKHPFFRRVGTKMFSVIIKLFCKKKITDPTSGFQLLDRNVIKRYSQMGKYPEFPDANLIIEMLMEGYKIEEVSVKMKECDDGVSMHGGIIKPIKYMINVTYTIVFILIRGFRRDK